MRLVNNSLGADNPGYPVHQSRSFQSHVYKEVSTIYDLTKA